MQKDLLKELQIPPLSARLKKMLHERHMKLSKQSVHSKCDIDLNKFTFRQIEADTEIKSFNCGDADLNDFLLNDAKNYLREMMALT